MSKRYTDTEKWKDEWFGSLSNDYRIVWQWLLDGCSFAGIWKKNFRGLNFDCNTKITEEDFKSVFGSRVLDQGGFYFIPKFIKFQYPSGLNSNKPLIVSVRKELISKNLCDLLHESLRNDHRIINESLNNDSPIIKEKEKVTVKEKVKEVEDRKVQEGKDPTEEKVSPLQTDYTEFPDHVLKAWPAFEIFLLGDCPRVQRLSKPITIKEYSEHFNLYESGSGRQVLLAMENRKNLLTSYTNANLTFLAWIKKDFNNGTNKLNIHNGYKSKVATNIAATDGLEEFITQEYGDANSPNPGG